MRKTLRNIILILNMLAIVALVFAYVSVFIAPDVFWIPSLFGLAYPWLLAVNVVFAVFWLIIKPRYAVLSLIATLGGWTFLTASFQLNGKETEQKGIKVLSFNVKHFYGNNELTQKDNAEQIIAFLNQQNADIICLQEARLRKNNIFNLGATIKRMDNIEHYQFARSSTTFGSVTMTRYPIVNMEEIRFEDSRNITICTDVVIAKDTIRIYNVHLQSYHIDPTKYSVLESPGIDEEEDIRQVREMGSKFKKACMQRAGQVRTIRRHMDNSPYPVIVCGDFNDTPVSYAYRVMSEDFKDAFIESGKGLGTTYVGDLPALRIDYILYSPEFDGYNFKTLDVKLSDHLPVLADLVIE
jgi:endonuclease/exonuclease/phosphatase family metal-dependent hydrolase